MTSSWLVRDSFVTDSWPILVSFLTHSWLALHSYLLQSHTHRYMIVRVLTRLVRETRSRRTRLVHDSFVSHPWLIPDSCVTHIYCSPTCIESYMIVCSIRDLFVTYLQFARDLFVTRSWLLYRSPPRIESYMGFVIRPWLVRDLFVTHSWLLYRSPTRIESYMIVRGLTHVALRGHTGKISQTSAPYWGHHIINTTKAIWEFLHDARRAVGAHR